jgi:iron complex transport system permease protein
MGVVITIAAISVFLLSKPMSAFLVSESYAKSVGVNINSFKIKLVILSSLLSACVTAFAGPVSFVGIAVPHLVRKLISNSKPKYMIPACFFLGAVFTCICDLLSRTLFAPTELSISTVTAIFGSPVVIYMMIKRSKDR